jgi:hypothetical protein
VKRVFWLVRISLVLLALGALSACGHNNAGADPGPEVAHAAWVYAMRDNSRDAALALVAPMHGNEVVLVDGALQRMQQIRQDQSNGVVATGPLGGVDTLPLTDAGQGKVGISVWRWEQQTWCWETTLTPTEAGWKVTNWKQRLHCPGEAT